MSKADYTHKIPPTVWALGFVSLFMDISSEMVHSLLPLLLVNTMGASMISVGIIEGVAEATALIVKLFSGALSDYMQNRKKLLLLGYGLAAATKPMFPLAHSIETVFVARFLDRIGKGIRGAPRDALLADVSPPEIRGACFGLRQSMDTVGAVLGPLLATLLMIWYLGSIRLVLWFAFIPAIICVLLIAYKVKEAPVLKVSSGSRLPSFKLVKNFPASYRWILFITVLFTLAKFSEAFLVLKALEAGFEPSYAPLAMVVMSVSYAISAYPAGKFSDRFGRLKPLYAAFLLLAVADLVLASSTTALTFLLGVTLWGFHLGFSQGVLSAMVADCTPPELKGTAFGVFSLVTGIFMLLASVLAGVLWQNYGSALTFYAGAIFSALSLLLLLKSPKTIKNRI